MRRNSDMSSPVLQDIHSPPRGTLYPQKLALTLPTSGSRSVGIAGSRTKATDFITFTTISWIWAKGIAVEAAQATLAKVFANKRHSYRHGTQCSVTWIQLTSAYWGTTPALVWVWDYLKILFPWLTITFNHPSEILNDVCWIKRPFPVRSQ
jgi:hypothetical protein